MNSVTTVIGDALRAYGVQPDPVAMERFQAYHQLFVERNRLMDLSNVPDGEMPRRHYVDSILPLLRYPGLVCPGESILDVGSGAGLPGVPLAIYLPEHPVALLESNGRRCDFLREVIGKLALNHVQVIECRAETAGRDVQFREKFDITVSRAVAALPELLEYMLPLTRTGGKALCWKGRRAEEEIAAAAEAAQKLGGAELTALPYGTDGEESLLIRADKRAATPDAYPRRVGIPHKRPIGG